MKPFLLRMSKAHYLINLQLYTIDNRCRIPPNSNSPNYRWAETHMVSNHYQVSFVFCWGWPSMTRWSMIRPSMVDGTENRFEGVISSLRWLNWVTWAYRGPALFHRLTPNKRFEPVFSTVIMAVGSLFNRMLLIVGLLQWGTDMYVSQNIKELLYRPSRINS